VPVANDKQVLNKGRCTGVRVKMQEFLFITEAFVIVLSECDMTLGIQWLVTLGSIIWNFKDLTMEFTIAKKTILLQGLALPNLLVET
jgi:hypothetical protein